MLGDDNLIDTHYDLLTILYCCYLKKDFSYIEKIKKDITDVEGMISNLYFMNKEEMLEELQIKDIDVFEMFKVSTNLYKENFSNLKTIFSIEGCDYIKDEKELVNLYNLGLRNILLVWNNKNKYGSGNKTDKGLTNLGKIFLKKAVELGISIDMSHMNKNTFWDTIDFLKELKKDNLFPKVIASHSNCYSICKHKRNLDDEQILAIKELDGLIGLVLYGPFINEEEKDLEINFLKNLKHLESLIGIDNIMISTDNMNFATDLFNIKEGISLYNHKNIKENLTKLLKNNYNEEEINKVLYKNVDEKLF